MGNKSSKGDESPGDEILNEEGGRGGKKRKFVAMKKTEPRKGLDVVVLIN